MYYKYFGIICLLFLLNLVVCKENLHKSGSDEKDEFIPTHDWKVVKEGQSIPKGLHIRINMQTGLKEAKLLDVNDNKPTKSEHSNALLDIDRTNNNDKEELNSLYSPDELKKVLKNIKSDDNLTPIDKNNIKEVKSKFKNYEQLKKELGELNLSVKTDIELLRELFTNFETISTNKNLNLAEKENDILHILENIEYLVHQIDNANEFINLNGLTRIIYSNLNSTNTKIKCEALNILGSCVQNNAKAQISSLESGAIEIVLRLLVLDSNDNVKMRAVYSLSSLLRRFPTAQNYFIKNGGLTVFAKIFSKPHIMKLQLKVITLIYDLLIEQKDSLDNTSSSESQEKAKQYELIGLKDKLIENGWCAIFENVFINNALIEQRDHDAIERCLNAMLLVIDKCVYTFENKNLENVLKDLYTNYENLSDNFDDSSYFIYLKDMIFHLLSSLNMYKTEL